MDANKLVKITRKRLLGDGYCAALTFTLLLMLYSQPSYTFWWWFTFTCLVTAISVIIADACYVYAKYLIHKHTGDDNG